MAVIEISDLYYRYPVSTDWVLKGINFRAKRGEYIILTGPSGCGKSTFARVLNGLIPNFYGGKLRGIAKVMNLDISRTPTYILAKHVGMVFQNPENQLFFSTVEREIAFGLENLGYSSEEISDRVEETLERFNLVHLRNKAPYELSGGQQQRVAIASVMAMDPEILVMDEPTANLDPLSALEILKLVKENIVSRGKLAIVIEHRLELALRFATRIVVMVDGRIIADGQPFETLQSVENIVGVPKIVKLYYRLLNKGVYLKNPPRSPEEMATYICSELGARDD